jgi:hypothetical protein
VDDFSTGLASISLAIAIQTSGISTPAPIQPITVWYSPQCSTRASPSGKTMRFRRPRVKR